MTLLAEISNPETGQKTGMRILIDPACNRTALTESAAKKIGLKLSNKTKTSAKGMGERQVEPMSTEAVQIALHVRDEDPIVINTRLTSKIADNVPVYNLQKFRAEHPECSQYFIPPTGDGCPVDIIIGTDRLLRLLTLHKSVFVSQSCQLMSTKFGWLLMVENTVEEPGKEDLFNFLTRSEDIVKLMWDLDLVGLKGLAEPDTEYEERALKVFYDSIKYVNGRYEIRWPWRTSPPNLNENYGLAMGRLKTLLKKLQQQPQLLKAYHEIIQQQIKDDVVEDVPRNSEPLGTVIHYIPHHAVICLDKSTEVRIVYDAAATTGRSRSLNKNMLKGTKWLGTTVSSLLRFRKYKKAVTADIRHAFHQIAIAPPDRDAVRFIWVHDISKPPQGDNIRILRFKRVAFGIVASPFLLYATIQHHLRNNQTEYTDQICREMYADNLLISFPTSTDEINFYKVTKKLFEGMAMNITKWKSNVPELQNFIPPTDKIPEQLMSVLGLEWNSEADKLKLRLPKISHLEKLQPTKRVVLKTMASIFDPLGWVAPFVLRIRIFLRRLWQQQKLWETPLLEENLHTWIQLKQEIQLLNTTSLSRMYFRNEYDEDKYTYKIHTFVDASAEAIGAVSYFRQKQQSSSQLAFLMAKTRLSPAAKLSIPRLEFYALLMGVRMHTYVVEALNLQKRPKQYIWSDSKCVLAWVTSNKLLPVAVERHLGEIRNAEIDEFRYVPTTLNPADVASRGATLAELNDMSWLTGPLWLILEKNWPQHVEETCEQKAELEKRVLFIQGHNTTEVLPPFSLKLENFSELKLLLRRTAYCLWLLHHYLKRDVLKVTTPIDYNAARMLWIRWDQRRNGSQSPQVLSTVTHFKGVQLFIDQFGVLRCKSRMANSKLPWTAVEPVILVKGSYLTELIVLDIHQRNFHAGTAQTLATLRKNYWLVHGRSVQNNSQKMFQM